MELGAVVFWLLLVAMVVVVVATIARGKLGGGSGAGMPGVTALHDLSPADRQRAIEIVVEQKAGKKWMEQESGGAKEPGGASPPSSLPGKGGELTPPA